MNVLSIDGGGILGLIPCIILAEIIRRANKCPNTLFDIVGGTSTGSIIAAFLTSKAINTNNPA